MTDQFSVRFDVVGLPAPQGSKSAFVRNGRAVMAEGGSSTGRAKHKAWRIAVAEAARIARDYGHHYTGPTALTVAFRFPRPKSRPKSHHGWHTVKPDKDKVLRATLDGLVDGGLLRDDAQVCLISISATEVTEWTGASIYLRPTLTPLEDVA